MIPLPLDQVAQGSSDANLAWLGVVGTLAGTILGWLLTMIHQACTETRKIRRDLRKAKKSLEIRLKSMERILDNGATVSEADLDDFKRDLENYRLRLLEPKIKNQDAHISAYDQSKRVLTSIDKDTIGNSLASLESAIA